MNGDDPSHSQSQPPFGHYTPGRVIQSLITAAQRAPRNWLGKQLAQIARRIVLLGSSLPIDVAVGKVRMRCQLSDNNSERKYVFMPWRFDARERELLLDSLPPDGVFVDVGANVGIYTLVAATALGPAGRVVALEPNPPAFRRLRFNVEATRGGRQDWPRIDVVEVGISDREGNLALHLDPSNLGGSSVAMHSPDIAARTTGGSTLIACRPLASVLRDLGIDRVSAMKIDIEGAEDVALLPYLSETPDSALPHCLVVENSANIWRHDLTGALLGRGYEVAMHSRLNIVFMRQRHRSS